MTRPATAVAIVAFAALLAGAGWWFRGRVFPTHDKPASDPPSLQPHHGARIATGNTTGSIVFSRSSWKAAGIEIHPVERTDLAQSVALTGKVALNEDRLAHIFPLVEGRVDEVKVHFGDKVKKEDLLVVVQSKEVGQAMLQLFQDRLQRDFAVTKDRWTQAVVTNTQAMIRLIRDNAQIEDIEKQLQDRPMGEYRDKLMTASIAFYKSRRHMDRLAPLAQGGSVTGKQMLEAESELNASRATLQSLLEQIQQDTQQASLASIQAVKELQTRVSIDETNLKILGFRDDALSQIDPARQGETISHYPVRAPFDGTIISKDVVLMERVGPSSQLLGIADLSTVWVTADIYEEHLPLLKQLEEQVIRIRSDAWPEKSFDAKVFYTGDLVNESSRTISLRALADNAEGYLKPGMFINVELPSLRSTDVLQVPPSAIQDYEGKSFVFMHLDGDKFERRDVIVGRRNPRAVEVLKGLSSGDNIVTSGGFALKSQMLADLLSE